ncbi:MAG: hypothetical protein CO021_06530 [Deltaproteobacteria bacterium CG_4_9_14_0_2_um_filter_42_21]|nr:MAG: hypothetical protein CO021_06530 [Deltaproteobacteria bacterium CG_4_9_14_0_2_um_filter_42_21]
MRERRQSLAERIAHDKPLVENRVSAYWKLVLLDAQNTADSHWETVWAKALAAFTRFAVAYIDANHQVTQIQPSNPTQFANGLNPQQDSDQLRALKRQHEDLGHDEEARIARNEAAEKSLESREVQLDQQAKEFAIMIDKQTHSILQRAEELGLQMQQALAAADRARDSIKLHEDRIAQLESRSGELDALKQQQIDALPKA